MARQTTTWQLTPEHHIELRQAMLSVYYRSLGRQWALQGAPAVLLPPEMRPLSLAEALHRLESSPARLRDAIWRVIRSVPLRADADDRIEKLYPPELLEVVDRHWLAEIDARRRDYRAGANLFTVALESCAAGRWDQAEELLLMLQKQVAADEGSFSRAVQVPLDQSAVDFLRALLTPAYRPLAKQLPRLEDEVGLTIHDFVRDLADAAAFLDSSEERLQDEFEPGPMTVYPVSSAIRQNSATLTTTATVTTFVRSDFETLSRAIDPRSWPHSSDVIKSAQYVGDAFTFQPFEPEPLVGSGTGNSLLLKENAALSWGRDADQEGSFDNVLNTIYKVREPVIDLRFSLSRSIRSRVLWDDRAGGILIDQGYIKVRPFMNGRWRITRRKVLRFSDRTPHTDEPGSFDYGQTLNYLAPAALSWWIESETYSMESTAYVRAEAQRPVANLEERG